MAAISHFLLFYVFTLRLHRPVVTKRVFYRFPGFVVRLTGMCCACIFAVYVNATEFRFACWIFSTVCIQPSQNFRPRNFTTGF